MLNSAMMNEKMRVIIADSHTQVRTQLATRLEREKDIEVIAQAANSGQMLRYALSSQPDVLLIDPMMRDGFGLANLRQVVSRLPNTAIIVHTAYIDTSLKLELKRMGVENTVSKGLDSDELVTLIREAAYSSAHL